MRTSHSSSLGIGFSKEVHPVIVEYILTQFSEWPFSFNKFVNFKYSADIACVTAPWSVTGNLPLWLNKEDKLFNNRFDYTKFIYRISFLFITVSIALLVQYSEHKMAFVFIVGVDCILVCVSVAKVPPV